ncbi:hypothetical protein FLJC2902T_28380 [Flavobacterium limnosediminis JC2902]|uniref:Plasmid stabilization system n=1 Tax=Flavobacterium limnosediminis JC2902 TaxID=1341181 RepID=V6SIS6_9FLAO|nr:hypothetical protein FLJC2902T_28380 [Flavobacterium limnosediminis JC2902]
MNYNVKILEEARFDFIESFEYYKEINLKLGEQFKNSFKRSLKTIKSNPLLFQIRYNNTRVIFVKSFPYLIHFSLEGDTILIKAIFHTSRDSKIWITRK